MNERVDSLLHDPIQRSHTRADEHDGVHVPVQCPDAVHHDAGQGGAPGDQQRPPSQRAHRLVHQGPVPDELQGLVWEVQRTPYAEPAGGIVDALRMTGYQLSGL